MYENAKYQSAGAVNQGGIQSQGLTPSAAPIESVLHALEARIEDARCALAGLDDQLTPVMRAPVPQAAVSGQQSPAASCSYEARLLAQYSKVDEIYEAIQFIKQRLCI